MRTKGIMNRVRKISPRPWLHLLITCQTRTDVAPFQNKAIPAAMKNFAEGEARGLRVAGLLNDPGSASIGEPTARAASIPGTESLPARALRRDAIIPLPPATANTIGIKPTQTPGVSPRLSTASVGSAGLTKQTVLDPGRYWPATRALASYPLDDPPENEYRLARNSCPLN